MNTEKRKIIIGHASSDDDHIYFELEHNPGYFIVGENKEKSIRIFIKNENESKNKDEYTTKKLEKNLIIYRLMSTFCITCIFIFLSFDIHFFLAFIISISIFDSLPILIFCFNCWSRYKGNSNHSAEHMICNFIKNHQKLPISLKELQKSSRFSKYCGSITLFNDYLHFLHFSSDLYASLGIYALFIFVRDDIPLLERVIFSIILIVIIILLVWVAKSHWFNFFLQLFTTTSNVDDSSLYLAYFVAREWILYEYPEYASEEWMQNNEFLNRFSKT